MSNFVRVLTAFLLVVSTNLANAQETITILWGFNIGSNQANTVRLLCDELNRSQDRYTFIIGHKPGAGGTIAATEVANHPANTLVSMSSSFIIRPYYEKGILTHNLDNFRPILVQGTGSPLFIVSSKYRTIDELLAKTDLSIGVSGIGSISHLAADEITGSVKNVNIINFKDMIEASTSAAGGHIDAAVGFLPDLQGMLDSGKIQVLGYTGRREIKEYPGLMLSKQIPEVSNLTANYAIFAGTDMPADRFAEIHDMLNRVNNRSLVVDSYRKDLLNISILDIKQSQAWYANERSYWKLQVEKIRK